MESSENKNSTESKTNLEKPATDKNAFNINLSLYQGPLDVLLYLIKQNEIDIYDIPIATITEQFLEYIEIMKVLAIDVATEFIVMAAYLIHLKSCMLLPKQELPENAPVEEDPRLPLVRQLLAHKEMLEATNRLEQIYEHQKLIFFREPEQDTEEAILLEELSISSLFTSFFKILKKRKFIKLSEIILNASIKEIIVIFLAILELVNEKRIKAFQNKEFSEIYVMSIRMAKKFELVKE